MSVNFRGEQRKSFSVRWKRFAFVEKKAAIPQLKRVASPFYGDSALKIAPQLKWLASE
jgi:hypothetical protein